MRSKRPSSSLLVSTPNGFLRLFSQKYTCFNRKTFIVSTPNGFLRLFSRCSRNGLSIQLKWFQPQTGSFGYLALVDKLLLEALRMVSTPNGFLRLFSLILDLDGLMADSNVSTPNGFLRLFSHCHFHRLF